MALYSEVAGEGPAVALVHEAVCDSRMWDSQWPVFTSSYRVLRHDMRGFGRTPIEAGEFSNASDLIELLARHGLEDVVLVGASMGARVALEVAVARPELVRALVLVEPGGPGHEWSDDVKASWEEEEAALEAGDLDAAVEVNLRTWVDGPRRGPDEVDPEVRERIGEMQRQAFELQVPVLESAREELLVPDLAERLGEIAVPTLVIAADEDVPDIAVIAERLGREIPNARVMTFSGAAHVPNMERPKEFNELVLGFLQEVA